MRFTALFFFLFSLFSAVFAAPTAVPTLPSDLFVSLLALLPFGDQYDDLYTTYGAKFGQMAYQNMGTMMHLELRVFGIKTGEQLGQRLGHCFAETGFSVPKHNSIITNIITALAKKGFTSQITAEVDAVMKQYKLTDPQIRDLLLQLAKQGGPQLTKKVVGCLAQKIKPLPNPNTNFDGHKLLTILPYGPAYAPLYRQMFSTMAEDFSEYAFKNFAGLKDFFAQSDLDAASVCLGQMLGQCVANSGWTMKNSENTWFTSLADGIIANMMPSVITMADKQIADLTGIDLNTPIGKTVKNLSNQMISTLGLEFSERALQCLFGEQSENFNSPECEKVSAQGQSVEFSPMDIPNKHHRREKKGKSVNVHVEIEA